MDEERKLKMQIGFIQKMLDILRQILGLQTKIEKLQLAEMIKRIAKEEEVDSEILLAVIRCESDLNPRAINKNPDGSTDYGLCQFNNYWYWTQEKIISPEEALYNPEKAVRVMAQCFKKGRAKDWICYRTGRYIGFLNKPIV